MSDSEKSEAQVEHVGQDVPQDEHAVSMLAPAHYVNRFIITKNSVGVRLAFLEQGGEGQGLLVRGAVFMGAVDAIALGRLLMEIFADVVRPQTQ